MGICLKPQPAERQGNARADIVALHIDKFQASATHIAHDPISMMKPGNDGERGAVGFLSAAQHFDVATQCFTNFLQKLRAVFGFTGRGGRDHFQLAHLHLLAQNAKPPHRRQRLIDAVIVQQPGFGNAAAQTAQDFLVEKYRRRPRQSFINDQSNRVGTNVDYRNRSNAGQATLGFGRGDFRRAISHHMSPNQRSRRCLCNSVRGDKADFLNVESFDRVCTPAGGTLFAAQSGCRCDGLIYQHKSPNPKLDTSDPGNPPYAFHDCRFELLKFSRNPDQMSQEEPELPNGRPA